ncbi:unnamed protein product [Amoebophrya sp. A120]|nr:unnamed protein product [Amoebophrya sp. A120]|eukprot:GSA120T00025701001.1
MGQCCVSGGQSHAASELEYDPRHTQIRPIDNTIEEEAAVVKTISSTEEAEKIFAAQSKGKRGGVSATPLTEQQIKNFKPPVYPKTAEEKQLLTKIVRENQKLQVHFGHLEAGSLEAAVDAMRKVEVESGETIITQGELGDAFYIVETGAFSIYVSRNNNFLDAGPPPVLLLGGDTTKSSHDKSSTTGGGTSTISTSATKVAEVGPGSCFGELALMYDAPRAATVVCTTATSSALGGAEQPSTIAADSTSPELFEKNRENKTGGILWALDRDPFRMLLVSAQSAKVHLYEGFLSDVVLFKDLNRYELGMLSDLLVTEVFETSETIVRQGEHGDTMYILEHGECKAYLEGDQGEVEVKHYTTQGEYFGEISLIKECPRRATVRASGSGCSVLVLKKADFDRVIGPIVDTLLGLLDAYPQYRAFFPSKEKA